MPTIKFRSFENVTSLKNLNDRANQLFFKYEMLPAKMSCAYYLQNCIFPVARKKKKYRTLFGKVLTMGHL